MANVITVPTKLIFDFLQLQRAKTFTKTKTLMSGKEIRGEKTPKMTAKSIKRSLLSSLFKRHIRCKAARDPTGVAMELNFAESQLPFTLSKRLGGLEQSESFLSKI